MQAGVLSLRNCEVGRKSSLFEQHTPEPAPVAFVTVTACIEDNGVVAEGHARLRCQVSAAHTNQHIDKLVDALRKL